MLYFRKKLSACGPEDEEEFTNCFGGAMLLWAAESGRVAILERLLDLEIDIESKNGDGQTALMLAISHHHPLAVRIATS